jgi:hypothetical protein
MRSGPGEKRFESKYLKNTFGEALQPHKVIEREEKDYF